MNENEKNCEIIKAEILLLIICGILFGFLYVGMCCTK